MNIIAAVILAFSVLGASKLFAGTVKGNKLLGYAVGSFSVCMLRFLCSFLSGVILWGDYGTMWGIENIWLYSFCYNGLYMLPEMILTCVGTLLLSKIKAFKKLFVFEN